MRALVPAVHQSHLTSILLDFYKHPLIRSHLGFKGGTAAMLFYGLPRFSVDLDFDLVSQKPATDTSAQPLIDAVSEVLASRCQIKDSSQKLHTLFWAVSYGEGTKQIKVEVSTRRQPLNNYQTLPLYGVSVSVLVARDMIAHKLLAIMDRKKLASRDLFDAYYFLNSNWGQDINYAIIESISRQTASSYFSSLRKFLESLERVNLLSGLGELVTLEQKNWVRQRMLPELIGLVERQIDMLHEKGGWG